MDSDKLSSFKQAFSLRSSSCWHHCECGEEFGSEDCSRYWYGLIQIDGTTYAEDCNCWHPLAERIMGWIDANKQEIAKYLNLEKQRLTKLAQDHPVVEVDGK